MVRKGKRKLENNTSQSSACTSKKTRLSVPLPDEDQAQSQFANLPHEILLSIFKLIPLSDRCQIARVCKNWLKASYDEFLWHQLDLTKCCLNSKQYWALFRHRQFSTAKSIKIRERFPKTVPKNKSKLSRALMRKLTQSCSRLNQLEIQLADLNGFDVTCLPNKLEKLSFLRCEIPMRWFQSNPFQNLISIDLSECGRIHRRDIKDLATTCASTLKSMKLTECYRIDDTAIEVIVAGGFTVLESLDLEGTNITQYGLQLIATKLGSQLVYLSLKDCRHLRKIDVDLAKASMRDDLMIQI